MGVVVDRRLDRCDDQDVGQTCVNCRQSVQSRLELVRLEIVDASHPGASLGE